MKINGLTLEQERAANLIAYGKNISDKEICRKVKVTISTLRSWKNKDEKFKVRVLQLFERHVELDRVSRSNRITEYLKPVYKVIRKKLKKEDGLNNMSLKDLLRIMSQLQLELRQDTKLEKKWVLPKDEEDVKNEEEENPMSSVRDNYKEHRSEKVVQMKTVR